MKKLELKWSWSNDAGVGLLTGRWVTQRPDAERLRPVMLSDGTVARVEHRTLVCVRSRWTGRVRSKKYASGSLLEMTGHWGFSVRSVLPERSVSFVAVKI